MNYYCGYFRKLFGLGIIFLFVVQTMRAEMVSYAQEPKDSVFTDEAIKSDAELLIGLSQVIERDKARLNNLKQDSIKMEPVFQQKSLELFQIEIQLDSLSNTDSSSQQLSMVELRREQLKIVVDFLLERRHAVHQQITILDRKIAKEREAVDFVIKGEATNVLETAEQIRVKERIEHLQDSINLPDSLLQTDENYFTNPNEYNWRITQAKRELELAKARFEVAKKKWIIVEQLLALNQDDFNTVESMLDTVTQHLKRWNNTIDPLEETLASLVRLDTAEQLQEVIQNNIRKTQSLSDSVANMLAADSSVLRNLRIRIARLSDFQDPLSNEVEDAANNIETKNRWLAYLEILLLPTGYTHSL